MFLAEFICLIIYYLHKGLSSSKLSEPAPKLKHKMLFCISGTFDLFNFFLSVFGLTMTGVSVYQMMYGGTPLWTFVFSIFYLKKKYYCHHYVAVILLLFGLITVGLASVIWSTVLLPM